jgi:hypothetical protein
MLAARLPGMLAPLEPAEASGIRKPNSENVQGKGGILYFVANRLVLTITLHPDILD